MALATTALPEDTVRSRGLGGSPVDGTRAQNSGVSWAAVFAGAAAAASLSLILLILGVGLGLSSVSPWAQDGIGATALGVSTIVWLTLTQVLASAMGGYLAGRLRMKWTDVHSDEVYFRDTAHGFLAWAVATLTTAALLTSVIASILGGGVQAGAALAGGVAGTAGGAAGAVATMARNGPEGDGVEMDYLVDTLFRRDTSAAVPDTAASGPGETSAAELVRDTSEVGRIFMNLIRSETLPEEDLRYVGQLVAQRTGLSQQEAQARVQAAYGRAQTRLRDAEASAREAADTARQASAYSALWLFVSLLAGAFVASLAATFGGRQRDA